MAPHQRRVVTEKEELDEKTVKLFAFLHGELFQTLPADEQDRLHRQFKAMNTYSSILAERIAAF